MGIEEPRIAGRHCTGQRGRLRRRSCGCRAPREHNGQTQVRPVEQRDRDVLCQVIAHGTPPITRMVIARTMFVRDFA